MVKEEVIVKKSLHHQVFPGGHPSRYWPGPTMLDFGDRTRTGVFMVRCAGTDIAM